jgi:hypothetical protein
MVQVLKLNRRYILFTLLLAAIFLRVSTQVAYAGWDGWDDWFDEKAEQAKELWDNTQQRAEEWWHDTSEGARTTWDETKEQAGEEWGDIQERTSQSIQTVDNWLSQIRATAASNLEQAVALAKESSGTYRRGAWSVIETEKRRQLCSEYNDPAKVGQMERRRGILTEGAIAAMKLLPVYDEKSGKIRTYDAFARDMVNQTPGLAGSDLANDPVRCAALMLLDSDYLMYAKIIQTPNGKWISIREAQECGYRTEEAVAAGSDYEKTRLAYASQDAERVERYAKRLSSDITSLNIETDAPSFQFDPLWILPFGVLAIAGGTYMAWEQGGAEPTKKDENNRQSN